ncbi:MAG: deoxyribodipyrimidine photolyase [Polyangiales bacterium]
MLLPATTVPSARLRLVNDRPPRPERGYVLHWITAARRLRSSFALDLAVELARAFGRPLVVLEALRVGYPHASDRLHAFVLSGMAENAEEAARANVVHHAYVERRPGEGSGLLEALAGDACVVVTDDFPAFFLPRMVAAAAAKLDVAVVAVDSNGLVPMRAISADHASAYAYRREAQKLLPVHLATYPSERPLEGLEGLPRARLPAAVQARWPSWSPDSLRAPGLLASLPIDHAVPVVDGMPGGPRRAEERLARFVREGLPRYGERNDPEVHATSGLSPYLHFGHVSAHAIFRAVVGERFDPSALVPNGGKREGYFRLDPAREAFLDQLVVWRELGFSFARRHPDHDRYESQPAWARATLAKHAADPRPHLYDEAELEAARTHDPVWNAAQRELLETGVIHNYLRMLWGKKVLEWSPSPEEAFARLVRLNDRYALDGRDPNSYSGIGWVLGRFDRPWAPERPIFGQIRYMSSENTVRKLRLRGYLERFGGTRSLFS